MDENLLDKIDQYIRGKLPKDEAAIFQKEIAADEALQEAVDMALTEMDAMEYLLEEDLRVQVADWEKKTLPNDGPPKGSKVISPKWWFSLAAIAITAALFYFLKTPAETQADPVEPTETPAIDPSIPIAKEEEKPTGKEAPEEKVAENKSPEKDKTQKPTPPSATDYSGLTAYVETQAYQLPGHLANRRSDEPNQPDNALTRGIKAFVSKDYKMAVKELESINKTSNLYEAAMETLPHAYFKDGQYAKAVKLFKEMADASGINKDEPEWYLLLSLMADYGKNKKAADALLGKIIGEEGHNYHKKATELKAVRDKERK